MDFILKAFRSTLILLLIFSSSALSAQQHVLLEKNALVSLKADYLDNKVKPSSYYSRIFSLANAALKAKPYSVIHKTISPPSNDKHDYLSISRYWWPDANKEDGLPWIRRDGVTNPSTQTDDVDRKRLGSMVKSVEALALAYYYSDDLKYAVKAAELLRVWFLNPETKMNPNLQYAQSIPGHNKLRRSGILDGRLIPENLLDAIVLISKSGEWDSTDQTQMNAWLRDYLNWLIKSDLGKAGAQQENNHGSWYHFQVSALAYYLQNTDTLKASLEATKKHISKQFDKNGAQPHELSRTRSYFYSTFNLDALSHIATIAHKSGLNLWHFPSKEQSILKGAVEYLIPAAKGEAWPHPERNFKASDLRNVLRAYIEYYPAPEYKSLLNEL